MVVAITGTPIYWIISVAGVSVFLLTEGGQKIQTEAGNALLADNTISPPDWLVKVIQARWYLGDPPANQFIYSTAYPDEANEGNIYTNGDGNYYRKTADQWVLQPVQFGDGYIRVFTDSGIPSLNVAINNIDQLIARINPADYITSGNAGGQSVSFPSLKDVSDFFAAKKKALQDMAAQQQGLSGVTFLHARRPAVGGSYE
ncbi:hypothetical protein NO1_0589 [Candidatus Termititenax aidoneus]|uniref:Uncharacterized protein n=1 Tax=Termititenax aidoneus TaxID=2218524 RepID=A0A388T9E4_TERA1|nr:hypothetical protein NO1_0589 [Candidatus Termititenax aidoneus]